MNDKPTYKVLENRISELEKQNEILRLNLASEQVKCDQSETEKIKANLQLVRLTRALDKVNTYVYIKDKFGCYVYANEQTLKLFNCSAEELSGSPDSRFFPEETCKQLSVIEKRVFEHGEDTEAEVETKALDGSRRVYWEIKTPMLDINNKVIGLCGISTDITDRKKAKEELQKSLSLLTATLESTADGILVVDKNGKIKRFNNKFMKLWQISDLDISTRDDDKILASVLDQLSDPTSFLVKVKEVYAGDEASFDVLNFKDGRTFERYSQPQILDGKSIGRVWSFRDVTERKKVEQALKESEAQLRELNTTKDKLFSIIAHDLRSPFSGILGFTEILIENINDFETAETEEFVRIINSTAQNTLSLLDNLLNWAKTQTGQINFNPGNILLSSIIREIIELSHPNAAVKDISLIQNQSDGIKVYADENMLKTVLRNLISNAVKFTKPGGNINVYVILDHKHVEISISDNGVGINDETLKTLFDISTNTRSYDTSNETGSGLGLVLCKEFVKKLGGNIWVESEVGKGSDFKFTLPLCES